MMRESSENGRPIDSLTNPAILGDSDSEINKSRTSVSKRSKGKAKTPKKNVASKLMKQIPLFKNAYENSESEDSDENILDKELEEVMR